MKMNGTYLTVWRLCSIITLLFVSVTGFTQPEYDFTSGSLISGVDRQVNAQYRYNNVRPNVDARVTITAMTGGLTLSAFDGGSGFAEALQPHINVPANSSGYVEYRVDFFVSGSNLTTPSIQIEVPVTPIDVDGQSYSDGQVNEFDLVYIPNGYYLFDGLSNEISISRPMNGMWVQGTNTATIDYPGIDTVVRRVMFSVMNATVTSVTFRVGATNTTPSSKNRLRSVYFKKFLFSNPVLPVSALKLFQGNRKNGRADIKCCLYKENDIQQIELEKSYDGREFRTVSVFLTIDDVTDFNFSDPDNNSTLYYRLKLVSANGLVNYSHIIAFREEIKNQTELKIYPSHVNSGFNMSIQASRSENCQVEIMDMSGRIVERKIFQLTNGHNQVQVTGLERLPTGTYTVIARSATGNSAGRIVKQ